MKNTKDINALVRARQSANRKMMTYITGMQAAENYARSSDARWNEKWADYWKGRRDGLREALAMIGPNDEDLPQHPAQPARFARFISDQRKAVNQ